ncbi:MAG: C69 family dipeptidase, partial [Bacteroides sp.]
VSQMRADLTDGVGGVLLFGMDDANMTVYTPVYCCTNRVPKCYAKGQGDYITFSWNSSFWIFNWVANMVYPRYSLLIDDVRTVQEQMESTFSEAQSGIESAAVKMYASNPDKAKDFLNNYTNMTAQTAFDAWKQLGEYLIVKYNDGVVKRIKDGKFERTNTGLAAPVIRPGYPTEFLEKLVETTGDRYKIRE